MTTANETLPFLICETASVLRNDLDRRLRPQGLSHAKLRTIFCLSRSEKPLTQTELAARMGIEGATLVGLLDGLEKMGWIERLTATSDRRSKVVSITAKAQKTLLAVDAMISKLHDEILNMVGENELSNCINLLIKIKNRIETIK
jgi:MarR family transcriptional regulator, transcriptional regulator for hemolysin